MGNYNKWNRGEADTNPSTPVYVVLFVSRNKDNKQLENFKERRNAFVTTQTVEQLQSKFQANSKHLSKKVKRVKCHVCICQ